ncbi:TonB-dependent receptor plug domain-containing protein [Sessilibacter sp. MAH4]
MKRKALSIAVKGAIALTSLSLLAGGNAYAQDEVIEEVTVTGSRLVRKDLESVSPVTVISGEEFKLSGILNVEQKLAELPAFTPSFGPSSNNPGDGTARADLRGLGANRTLVLVNGRRYIPSTQTGIVDLNTIPASLIENVDVVTGGASAVYGSDALAGVVNFTLKDDFEGAEISGLYDITEDGDGEKYNIDITIGGNFDEGRGNAVLYGSFSKREAVFQGDRGFSRVALTEDGDRLVPGGSITVPSGLFQDGDILIDPDGVPNSGDEFSDFIDFPGGVASPLDIPGGLFNYAPDNYLQLPQERYLFSALTHYDLNEKATLYGEVNFAQNRVPTELAPTPATVNNVELNPDSPFFDPATQAALDALRVDTNGDGVVDGNDNAFIGTVRRRLTENGSRQSETTRDAFRVLFGLEGKFTDTWSYDISYSNSRLQESNTLNNDASETRLREGLLVTDDGLSCQSGSSNCVPVNIFGEGVLTQDAVDFINVGATNITDIDQEIIQGSVSGELITLPSAEYPIALVFGYEHRVDDSNFRPDTFLSSGDVLGFNAGDATVGSFSVEEFFLEANVPIIQGKRGAEDLSLWGAYRTSDYSNIGSVDSYAFAINYAPIKQLGFRVGIQEAVRAPNVAELFQGQTQGFPPATDPCAAGGSGDAATCIAAGVDAADVGVFDQGNTQIEGVFGGNPDLKEESSTTFTAGIIWQPLNGLDITLDYYDIEIEDAISVAGGGVQNVLNLCYNDIQDISNPLCQAVSRGPDGRILEVTVLNENIGEIETSGIDLNVHYTTDLAFGLFGEGSSLSFTLNSTFLDTYDVTPVAGLPQTNECAGAYGNTCGEPLPEVKWNLRSSWTTGPLTLSALLRYIDSTTDDQVAVDGVSSSDLVVSEIDDEYYLDLTAAYSFNEDFTASLVFKNVLDTEPTPLGDSQQQANTFPSTYDLLGPRVTLSATYKFR